MIRTLVSACVLCLVLSSVVGQAAEKKAETPKDPEKALKTEVKKANLSGTLKEAFRKCHELCGVPIVVEWPVLRATGVKEDTKVAVKAESVTVEQLLELVLAKAAAKGYPLAWYVDDDTVRVTTQKRMMSRRTVISRPVPTQGKTAGKRGRSVAPRRRGNVAREVEFNKTRLEDVIDFFRDLSGVSFYVDWRAMEQVGVDRETPITLKLRGLSVGSMLTIVTDSISGSSDKLDRIYWIIDGGIVKITTGTALDSKMKVRIYDVADLLVIVPNFIGPRIETSRKLDSTSSGDSDDDDDLFKDDDDDDNDGREELSPTEQRQKLKDNLIAIIKNSIGNDMWLPQGKGSIRLFRNRLIISQTQLGFKLLDQAAR